MKVYKISELIEADAGEEYGDTEGVVYTAIYAINRADAAAKYVSSISGKLNLQSFSYDHCLRVTTLDVDGTTKTLKFAISI